MKLVRTLAAAVVVALLISACGGGSASAPINSAPEAAEGVSTGAAAPGAPVSPPSMDQAGQGAEERPALPDQPQAQALPSQRLVIRNASLSLQVESVRDAEAAVRAKVAQLEGYVVSSQLNGADEYLTAVVVFRVPSERFDEALTGVQGLAQKVLGRTVTGEDVTEEYVDLESRLRALEASRDQLLTLLKQSQTVEEALSVNSALTDVQTQVEQVKGRMQYLKQNAALSTVSVELRPVPITTIVEEDSWQPSEVARRALRDLVEFGQGLASMAIVLAIWSPIWGALFLAGRWGWRRLGRGRKSPPAPPSTPTTPSAS